MKLSEYAKKKGISYMTAYRWAKSGKIPNCEIMETGTILINDDGVPENELLHSLKESNIMLLSLAKEMVDVKRDLKELTKLLKK